MSAVQVPRTSRPGPPRPELQPCGRPPAPRWRGARTGQPPATIGLGRPARGRVRPTAWPVGSAPPPPGRPGRPAHPRSPACVPNRMSSSASYRVACRVQLVPCLGEQHQRALDSTGESGGDRPRWSAAPACRSRPGTRAAAPGPTAPRRARSGVGPRGRREHGRPARPGPGPPGLGWARRLRPSGRPARPQRPRAALRPALAAGSGRGHSQRAIPCARRVAGRRRSPRGAGRDGGRSRPARPRFPAAGRKSRRAALDQLLVVQADHRGQQPVGHPAASHRHRRQSLPGRIGQPATRPLSRSRRS